jgi:hypothetical protein
MIQLKAQQFRNDIRRNHIQGVIANKRFSILAEEMKKAKITAEEHVMEVEADKISFRSDDCERLQQCA